MSSCFFTRDGRLFLSRSPRRWVRGMFHLEVRLYSSKYIYPVRERGERLVAWWSIFLATICFTQVSRRSSPRLVGRPRREAPRGVVWRRTKSTASLWPPRIWTPRTTPVHLSARTPTSTTSWVGQEGPRRRLLLQQYRKFSAVFLRQTQSVGVFGFGNFSQRRQNVSCWKKCFVRLLRI